MSHEFANVVRVLAFMIGGTIGIALLAGWALKRLGPPKK